MPRNYVRKTLRATCYTPDDLVNAIHRVENKELSMYAASKEYNIPVATLHNRIYKKTGIKSSTLGRPTALPYETEVTLANGLTVLEKWGFGLSRKEVLLLVEEFVRMNNISTSFKDGIPGPDWFTNFRKRHKLSLKKAQPVEHIRRKNTDPFIVDEYFNLLKSTIQKLNLEQRPDLIWNLEETSVSLDPSKTKVVGRKGAPCSRTTHETGKEHITVLTAVSASAKKLTPLIIFKGKYVWDSWMAETKDKYEFELSYASSKRGWMETDIFHNYMEKVFIPGLGEERPVMVVYDGHSTHVDIKVVELAQQHNVTILKLPPHTSHHLQPLDVAVFKSFKTSWDAKLVEWQRHNFGVKLPKKVFSDLFAEIWNNTKPETIINGFKKAGIYPFNSQVISSDKYDPRSYKRWEEMQKTKVDSQLRQDSVLQSFEGPNNSATLSELCLNVICRKTSYDTNLNIEEIQPWLLPVENSETVHLLKDLSKREEHALPFIAERANDLPTCLFSKEFSNEDISTSKSRPLITKPNINVTSNIIINYPHSFEDLLLQRVQQSPRSNNNTKKKRVALGAEVITETMRKDFMNNKTRAVLQTEIVPKKKLKINKISKIPKDINIINKTAAIYDGEISQIRKNITKKDRIKKENQQKKTLKKRKNAKLRSKLTQYSETDSSSSETQFKIVSTDDSDYENLGEFIESCLREQEDDQENIEPVKNLPPYGLSDLVFYEDSLLQLKEDNWLVVQFATKTSIKHFVGTVLSVEDEMPVIKFVRKVKQSKSELATTFSYPIVDDVCTVINKEDIICVLPQPIISRRGQLIFNVDLSNYNIQ